MRTEKYKPGALMHFATYAYVGESVERPLLYYENNFAGTATLLRTVIDHQSVPVVFSSMMSSVLRKLGPRMVATHRSYHYTIKNRADKLLQLELTQPSGTLSLHGQKRLSCECSRAL
jgi:nucleoside-diphosphate-sugar epimerase